MGKKGVENIECRTDGALFDITNKAGSRFNTTIEGIEEATSILVIGANPRWEATMVNARMRKAWFENRTPVAVIGEDTDFTYPTDYFGASLADIEKNFKDIKPFLDTEKPMIVVGMDVFKGENSIENHHYLMALADKLGVVKDGWNGFNILHTAASRMAAMEMEFYHAKGFDLNEMGLVYLLGVDNAEVMQNVHPHAFVIYQGHHGDVGAHRADLILPGAAYTEKDGIYMNLEGRVQRGRRAIFPPGEAREDWTILRAISDKAGHSIEFKDIADVRAALESAYPVMGEYDQISAVEWNKVKADKFKPSDRELGSMVENFYMTNPITRASETMRRCSEKFLNEPDEMAEAAE